MMRELDTFNDDRISCTAQICSIPSHWKCIAKYPAPFLVAQRVQQENGNGFALDAAGSHRVAPVPHQLVVGDSAFQSEVRIARLLGDLVHEFVYAAFAVVFGFCASFQACHLGESGGLRAVDLNDEVEGTIGIGEPHDASPAAKM